MTAQLLLAQYVGPQDFGSAMITVGCIAGLAIVGSLTFAFVAHIFFGIADGTAAGQDEIKWPEEPMTDRFTKAIWLGWTLLLTASPTHLFGRALAGPRMASWLIGLFGTALLFPLFLMSMQIGGSLLHVIHPDAYRRLTKRPDHLVAYYAAVAIAYALMGFGWYAMFRFPAGVSFIGAFVVSIGIVLAARLYGRLAHLVSFVKSRKREKFVESPGILIPPPRPVAEGAAVRATGESYGLRGDTRREPEVSSAHQSSLKRIWVEEGADDPYLLSDGPAASPPPRIELPEAIRNPSKDEMELAMRNRPIPPPNQPWTTGTFSFPFRPENWKALAWLTSGIFVSGLLMRGITL